LASYIVSCVIHLFVLLIIINYPQLLVGGMNHRFRPIVLLVRSLMSDSDKDDQKWRTVAVLGPESRMNAPSEEMLRKILKDWEKKGKGEEVPPVRVRFGDEQKAAMNQKMPPMPKVRQEPRAPDLALPANELATAIAAASSAGNPPAGQPGNAPGVSALQRGEPAPGKKDTINLPPPGPSPGSDASANVAPKSIPEGIKQPPAAAPAASVKVFENEQKAIHSSDSGIFDTNGFPLGEYANVIKERIKARWLIPSNLQNFQGHTTLVFFIDKDGRYNNARIVTRSGNNSFDNAALMAVIESDPFPPLPKGFPGNHIGAKFVLSWNEP
jgi:TonB family protein